MFKLYENVPVLPISQVLGSPHGRSEHKLGPIWPDWEKCEEERFKRKGKVKDDCPELQENEKLTYKTGNFFWGGPIVNHFGHQIADFSTRLIMYSELKMKGKFVFSVRKGSGFGKNDVPAFFVAILEWFQIDIDQVLFVESPMLLEKLWVCGQQEQLPQEGPSDLYLQKLDENAKQQGTFSENKEGRFYISRSNIPNGVIAGERYIENYLELHGITIIRPENMKLREQLEIYSKAKELVFGEGSALHGLQLLGHIKSDVHILCRRPNHLMSKMFLTKRCKTLRYYPAGELVCGINAVGQPAMSTGITIAQTNKISDLFKILKISLDSWSESEFKQSIKEDVFNYLDRESDTPRAKIPNYIDIIEHKLKSLGVYSH
ncbi:glycosyltransferase family 61 protein [Aliiglaciecola sp. 3_MG-2023]|uniref:glycosyltransferase 61 family protein n=1 Tax=Aliiglaciecola sp. 3_MG-2023 TaxID=3062644 RepID=UPI0026E3CF93|nr:glycosyltransferase family 61 protein [Aliiglaciecola sp. 3_MG-2023]MDO6691920.1 glycosyltransferase family 61 protein [Aliiglaciecola sp. 3_MG-2023]